MWPYKGRTPRPFQGPKDDPSGRWLALAALLVVVFFVLVAKFQDPILRTIGWW